MRDMGFNLMLVQRDTDIVSFLGNRLPTIDMPQEYIERLAKDRRLTLVTHLVATLRARMAWNGHDVLLNGYLPEASQAHMKHESPMGYTVEPGSVLLGYHLGRERQVGQSLRVKDKEFRIAQILPEQGSEEDGQIAMSLSDAQALLGKPGKINLILALECRCGENSLPEIRKQLTRTLPETQVVRDVPKAVGRAKQREMVAQQQKLLLAQQKASLDEQQHVLEETRSRRENVQRLMLTLLGVVTPLVVLAASVWIGLLALLNVRERRAEIGLLRALGKDSGTIALLFLGKALLVGLAGSIAGFVAGAALAYVGGRQAFGVPAAAVGLQLRLLGIAIVGAPLVAVLASYLPTLAAVLQDPAQVLRDT
jgi:putative ABC transport system permease protein